MRLYHIVKAGQVKHFNPRIPYGMRLQRRLIVSQILLFQSTHPVWDATILHRYARHTFRISIHASRMGCDDW